MLRRYRLVALLLLVSGNLLADKVIMKDGKIYEGRVIGESDNSVLISNPPQDPKPRFLPLQDVLTVVRERHPEEKMLEDDARFGSIQLGTRLSAYSSDEFSFRPAPELYTGGAFRIWPVLEVGGEFVFTPELSHGDLAVSDGTTIRGYESFYALQGGVVARVFPFFKKLNWRMEPYLTTGYQWIRLVPKASGDSLKGGTILGGAGVMIPWWKPLYWDVRFLYEHTTFETIHFLGTKGKLSGVSLNSYGLSLGLSWRFS